MNWYFVGKFYIILLICGRKKVWKRRKILPSTSSSSNMFCCIKKLYILHITPFRRAEIENIEKNNAISYIFNFSSATRGRVSNVNTLLQSLATWSKNAPQFFDRWSGCIIIKQNVSGGLIFSTMYI